MKIGLSLPNNWGVEDPLALVDLAVLAEDLGYDSVWVTEHLLNLGHVANRLGPRPYHHSLALLSFIAARTTRVSLGTSVLVLPFRHPVELAKFAATLDHLSGGRLILGVGAGAIREEFEALSLDYVKRGSITAEAIRMMKSLWTSQPVSFHGDHWSFNEVYFSPKPIQKPHVPLWIAGMTPAALRRTGTLGDGWHATAIPVEEFVAGREQIRRIAESVGRDPDGIVMSMRLNLVYGKQVMSVGESGSTLPAEDREALLRALLEWKQVGVDHMILATATTDMELLRRDCAAMAESVLPRVRGNGVATQPT